VTTSSSNMLIGRKADGDKVYVQARFEHLPDDLDEAATWRETVDHQQTTERLRLSFTGVVVGKHGSIANDGAWRSCGQVTSELYELTKLEPGWTVADVAKLIEIWDEWHLNDMNAGCVHQTDFASAPCPVTGYKWGHAWLFKPLPQKVFTWVSDRFSIEPPAPGSKS
jgi:hypothetical protein